MESSEIKPFLKNWLKLASDHSKIRSWLKNTIDVNTNTLFPALGIAVNGFDDTNDGKKSYRIIVRVFTYGDLEQAELKCHESVEHIYQVLKSKTRPEGVKMPIGFGGLSEFSVNYTPAYPNNNSFIYVGDVSFRMKV